MKTIHQNIEEVWPVWNEIFPLILGQKIISANIVNDKENFPKNFLEVITVWNEKFKNAKVRDLDVEQRKIFDFIIKYKNQITNIISDEMEKTKNCFTIEFKYKGEYLNKLTIPVKSISSNLSYLDYVVEEISLLLESYICDEQSALKHLDNLPLWRNVYYQLFDLPEDALKLKLKVWKENFPLVYEKLTTVLEIPKLEELTDEKVNKK